MADFCIILTIHVFSLMVGQEGQLLWEVVGHLVILHGKRPMAIMMHWPGLGQCIMITETIVSFICYYILPVVSPVIHMCTVEKSQCEVTVAYDPRIAHLDSEEYKIEWMEIGFYDSSNSWHSIHHKDGYDFSPNVLVALPPSREPVQRHLQVAVKYDNCLTPVFSKPYTVNQQPIGMFSSIDSSNRDVNRCIR